MAGKFDGDAFSSGDIMRRLRNLERDAAGLRTARRLESSSFGAGGVRVHSGGSITVEGGGRIRALHADGTAGVTYGALTDTAGVRSIGLLIQDDQAGGRLDIFRATKNDDPSLGKRVIIGSTDPANSFDVTANFTIFRHSQGEGVYFLDIPTTASAANAFINSADNGRLLRSTSSARYKQDIADHAPDPAAVLALKARSWRDKTEAREHPGIDRRHVGFVAEEVAGTMPEAVDLDADGQPDSVSLPAVVAGLVSLCQAQQARIETLEARLGVRASPAPALAPQAEWPRPPLPARPLPRRGEPPETYVPRPDGIDTDD